MKNNYCNNDNFCYNNNYKTSITLNIKKGAKLMADVRINIAVDEKTHRELKMIAVSQGKSLKEIVIEALKEKTKKAGNKKEVS